MEPRQARALSHWRCVRHCRVLEVEQAAALAGRAGAQRCRAESDVPPRGRSQLLFVLRSYRWHRRRVPVLAAALRPFSVPAAPGAWPPPVPARYDDERRAAERSGALRLAASELPAASALLAASEPRASGERVRCAAWICAELAPAGVQAQRAEPEPHEAQAPPARRVRLPALVLQWPWLLQSRRRGRDALQCAVSIAT